MGISASYAFILQSISLAEVTPNHWSPLASSGRWISTSPFYAWERCATRLLSDVNTTTTFINYYNGLASSQCVDSGVDLDWSQNLLHLDVLYHLDIRNVQNDPSAAWGNFQAGVLNPDSSAAQSFSFSPPYYIISQRTPLFGLSALRSKDVQCTRVIYLRPNPFSLFIVCLPYLLLITYRWRTTFNRGLRRPSVSNLDTLPALSCIVVRW